MERTKLIQEILTEGLNLVKKPQLGELRITKLRRLINAIKNDLKTNVDSDLNPFVSVSQDSIFNIQDMVNSRDGFMSIEIQFNLNRDPGSIKLKLSTYKPTFGNPQEIQRLMTNYINKVQTYYRVIDFLTENFYIYQDNYQDVKKGRVAKHEIS